MRRAALLTAALAVVSFAVVMPHTTQAAADPGGGGGQDGCSSGVSVSPQGVVRGDQSTAFHVEYAAWDWPGDLTVKINGVVAQEGDYSPDCLYQSLLLPASRSEFHCGGDNTVELDVKYDDSDHAPWTRTLTPLTVLCPRGTLEQTKVVGAGRTPLDFTDWDVSNGFDSQGAQQGDKTISVDGHAVGTVGYQQAPSASADLDCGQHTVTLSQPSTYGTLAVSGTIDVWCSSWSVTPQGFISQRHPQQNKITLSDPTTVYPSGTVATVSFNGTTFGPLGTMTPDPAGHLHGDFLDKEFLDCGGLYGMTADIIVDIVEPDPGVIVKIRQAVAPIEFSEHIPIQVLCPQAYLSHTEVVQNALPFQQGVNFWEFDGPSDPYNNRKLQPKSVFVNGVQVATSSDPDSWQGSMNGSCGENTVRVTQPTSFGVASAETTFSVLCPTVTADPQVISQASQPRSITVEGNAFHASESGRRRQPYVVTLDGVRVAADDVDEAGSLVNVIPASGLACGPHNITVTEQPPVDVGGGDFAAPAPAPAPDPVPDPNGPITAGTLVVVNCPSIIPPPVPPVVPPAGGKPQGRPTTPNTTLAIQPQIIIAGMTAQVTGTGF
ncbi:MAG TPA: hypothetical protein VGL39_04630, partial [Jatrophihabitantaceae bacterium]